MRVRSIPVGPAWALSVLSFLSVLSVLCVIAAAPRTALAATSVEPAAVTSTSDLVAALAQREYHLSSVPGGGSTAPSRGQGLRVTWQGGVVEVTPRHAREWTVTWSVARVGRADGRDLIAPRDVSAVLGERVAGPRIDWRRDGLTEWWVNGPLGIEQFLEVAERPAGPVRRPVVVEASVSGVSSATPTQDGGLQLASRGGDAILVVNALSVQDARGAALPAWLAWRDGVLSLRFDDRGAQYPVVLDPLLTTPQAVIAGGQNNANLGFAVASAGDVNGDGYGDVLVGAPSFDLGQTNEGAAFLHMGSPLGVDTSFAWRAEGDFGAAMFGTALAGGDVNGDYFSDVLVGAPNRTVTVTGDGAAYLWLGGPSGPGNVSGMGPNGTPANADWSSSGGQRAALFGQSVAVTGDVNADGYNEVLVGAPRQSSMVAHATNADGAAFAWFGGASTPTNPSGLGPNGTRTNADWFAGGVQGMSGFGVSVSGSGDVNMDGKDDIIVGADRFDAGSVDEGRAFVYMGPLSMPAGTAAWWGESNQQSAQFGYAVAGGTDFNCDGYDDILVGVPLGAGRVTNTYREGWAGAWYGGPSTPMETSGLGAKGTQANADWTAEAEVMNARFGWSVSVLAPGSCGPCGGAVIVGSPHFKAMTLTNQGAAFAWRSEAGAWTDGRATVDADWGMAGTAAGQQAGFSVAGLVDVDGDGDSDGAVGIPFAKGMAAAGGGEAHVFLGDPTGSGSGGCCVTDDDCPTNAECAAGHCNLETGECEYEMGGCDDGDACTTDTCVDGACVHVPMECNDFDPCTIDYCDAGICYHDYDYETCED